MSGGDDRQAGAGDATRDEFERRVRGLLVDSADALDGRTRSALTRARHAALAEAARPRLRLALFAWRSWAPAGALAMALLVTVFFVGQRPQMEVPVVASNVTTTGGAEDLALLSDADAYALSADGDMDLDSDFYEWAAASGEAGHGLGS